jgi:glutathione synthase/RimK-type ligase-like ATP-grasp enzyme
MKILLLKTSQKDYDNEWQQYLLQFSSAGSEVDINYYRSIVIEVVDDKPSVFISSVPLETYDFVYFKSWHKQRVLAQLLATYLAMKGNSYADKAVGMGTGMNKIQQTLAATEIDGLRVPDSYFFSSDITPLYSDIKNRLGERFIMKAISASEGNDNHLIESEESFIARFDHSKEYIFQQYIENDFDYRIGVIGGNVKYIKKRSRISRSTHLNNISQGAKVEYLDPADPKHTDLCSLAVKSANLFNIDIAGVDFIETKGIIYLLEVNPSPAYKNDPQMLQHLAEYFERSA